MANDAPGENRNGNGNGDENGNGGEDTPPDPDIGAGPDADTGDDTDTDTDTDTDLKPEPKSGTGPGPDTATDTSGGVSTPDRGVGVTDEVYDGLLWLGDHRAEVDALDTRYPANPDAAATVLYENNRDGAAAWITAHPNQYRRGQAEGFYLRGSDDDPNNADAASDADTDDAPTTPDTGRDPDPRPRGRRELIDEFLNVPEEWHATTAGFAIGYAIYTPDATLLAFALMLVGLDMATTVQWEGNEKLIREMRAEYPYAILGAVIGALLGLAHLASVGGDAVIADFVADAADGATGASAFWGPVLLAIFGGALIATALVMVTLKLAGLLP